METSSLAQNLVCSESSIREQAQSQILAYISTKASSAENNLNYRSMLKLWRALLRSLWMTDTLEKQEHVTDLFSTKSIEAMGGPSSELSVKYGDAFWNSISEEWEAIDRLRLDKFYLLMRKLGPLTLESIHSFISNGRVDGKKTPDSILLFIVENLLSFSEKRATDDLLQPFIKLFLTTKSEVVASRIKKAILEPLQHTHTNHPLAKHLFQACHAIASSDLQG